MRELVGTGETEIREELQSLLAEGVLAVIGSDSLSTPESNSESRDITELAINEVLDALRELGSDVDATDLEELIATLADKKPEVHQDSTINRIALDASLIAAERYKVAHEDSDGIYINGGTHLAYLSVGRLVAGNTSDTFDKDELAGILHTRLLNETNKPSADEENKGDHDD